MTARERFRATMNFETLDRPLYWEFGYWAGTLRRWYGEGLTRRTGVPEAVQGPDDPLTGGVSCAPSTPRAGVPNSLGGAAALIGECLGIDWRNPYYDQDVHDRLGFDEWMYRIPVNNCFCPPFEHRVLEEDDDSCVLINSDGETVQQARGGGSKRVLETSVKAREDFERLKAVRFQRNLQERLPRNWPEIRQKLKERTFPLMYGGNQGFFNTPRRLLGFEPLMRAFHDDPQLIKDINDHTADFLIAL